jgi:hypothetical protein
MICSFECTFCSDCATRILQNVCPNCGGEMVRRPVRPTDKRGSFPPSTARIYKPLIGERLEKHAALVQRYAGVVPSKR